MANARPITSSLVYLFVFTVIRYRTSPGTVMLGLALIRGLQQCLACGAFNLDFTAGIKLRNKKSCNRPFRGSTYRKYIFFIYQLGQCWSFFYLMHHCGLFHSSDYLYIERVSLVFLGQNHIPVSKENSDFKML